MLNILVDPLIGLRRRDGAPDQANLPELLALLWADEVEELTELRPHQAQAVHQFLAQLCAVTIQHSGDDTPPPDATGWRSQLRRLTTEWLDDEPWSLVVTDPTKPALLQNPTAGEDPSTWPLIESADALDMLVTSRNHDVKSSRIAEGSPAAWLYVLITLQTQEGFGGATKYGISRMNGGYSNRTAAGIAPKGGMGARLARDVRVMLRVRDELLERHGQLVGTGGRALLWLSPWNGSTSLPYRDLDPYYIEVCRRLRLVKLGARLAARAKGSKEPFFNARALNGNTGDPWAPIQAAEPKNFSADAEGFSYRRVVELISRGKWRPAPLQEIRQEDGSDGITLVFSAMARGQGKTEGLHQRLIPVPPKAVPTLRPRAPGEGDRLAEVATYMVRDAGDMQNKVLCPALLTLAQAGKDKLDYKAVGWIRPFLTAFDRAVDDAFFSVLWDRVAADPAAADDLWLARLKEMAEGTLDDAIEALPRRSMLRYRTEVRARARFNLSFLKAFPGRLPPRPAAQGKTVDAV